MKINDNIKSKILTFLEKENKKITQDYSFGNIINILSTYNKFIKDFLSNLCFLLTRISNEFNIKNKKLIFMKFSIKFFLIIMKNGNIFQQLLMK